MIHPKYVVEDSTKAIQEDPSDVTASYNRGFAYRVLGEPEKAVEDLSEVIRVKPVFAAYYQRRMAYMDMGRRTKL